MLSYVNCFVLYGTHSTLRLMHAFMLGQKIVHSLVFNFMYIKLWVLVYNYTCFTVQSFVAKGTIFVPQCIFRQYEGKACAAYVVLLLNTYQLNQEALLNLYCQLCKIFCILTSRLPGCSFFLLPKCVHKWSIIDIWSTDEHLLIHVVVQSYMTF